MSRQVVRTWLRHVPRLKSRGIEILRDPQTNKGTSYTLYERQLLGVHGLLPPVPQTQAVEIQRIITNLYQLDDDLSRYSMLMSLQDRNEKLFYKTIRSHLEYCLPLVYTPTVGSASLNYGSIFRRPRGLYITIQDRGHVLSILRNWPIDEVKAVVMTDGERILGYGDLGANGMAISLCKATLFTVLGSVQPHYCLPIMLDVGTDNEALLNDEYYAGLRQRRVRGEPYESFVDEVMECLTLKYGPRVCIQFEDFRNDNSFHFLDKYRTKYATFNDDIQCSAAVTLAGLLSSCKVTHTKLSDHKFLFFGAGQSALGVASLLVPALQAEGLSEKEAKSRIYMMDSKGLLVENRPVEDISALKMRFVRPDHGPIDKLSEVIRAIRPSVLIGASAVPNAFTREVLREMAYINKRPIIFALSNPTNLAECTAEMAYKATDCRCLFVSGSPFPPVHTPDGHHFYPSQGNNCYIFPGLALALTTGHILPVSDEMFLSAAKTLSDLVTDADLERGSLYPPIVKLPAVSKAIAIKLVEEAFQNKTAAYSPEPTDKTALVESELYDDNYTDFIPEQYIWPTAQT